MSHAHNTAPNFKNIAVKIVIVQRFSKPNKDNVSGQTRASVSTLWRLRNTYPNCTPLGTSPPPEGLGEASYPATGPPSSLFSFSFGEGSGDGLFSFCFLLAGLSTST